MTTTQSCASLASSPSSSANCCIRDDWSHSDHIKRESRHIFNKLHSIAYDSLFIRHIHTLYPSFLLTANLRCGAWYTDPVLTSAVSYFKSTDGHTHQWGFSLKRSNLHLVARIVQARGAVVVDSTRRGKSMPDALSKTIPIWCAVLNHASQRRYGCPNLLSKADRLETPRWMIPPTEHDQIEARLDGFVNALLSSDLEVPKLDQPLRPVFVTPQTDLATLTSSVQDAEKNGTLPIVLVSASKLVTDSAKLGRDATEKLGCKEGDKEFVYVQGAGDDHENWARGLTPDVFWKHQAALLACEKEELEALVDQVVAREAVKAAGGTHWFTPLASKQTTDDADEVGTSLDPGQADIQVGETGLFIGSRSTDHTFSLAEKQQYDLVVHFTTLLPPTRSASEGLADDASSLTLMNLQSEERIHRVHMTPNKKGLVAIRAVFPHIIDLTHRTLIESSQIAGTRSKVLICCQDGKDLSGSLVVAILALCFTDQRTLIRDLQKRNMHAQEISKDTTKRRLQWLVSANPRAAPSRAFLLRVNELLLSPRHRPTPSTV